MRKVNVLGKWPIEEGDYLLGNPLSPVAVLIPTKDELGSKLQKVAIEAGAAIVGFVYTANIGLEKVIINILANPNIRWLIVTGHENKHKAGYAMIMLWRYGVDEKTRRIKCGEDRLCSEDECPTCYIPNLPLEAIERFRRQVEVVDLLVVENVDEGKLRYEDFVIGTKQFKEIPTMPVTMVLKDSHYGEGYVISPPAIVVTEKHVGKVLELVIHACIQEPENKFRREIVGRYGLEFYEFYDKGAFDDKPYIVQLQKVVETPNVKVWQIDNWHIVIQSPTFKDAYLWLLPKLEKGEIGITRPTRHGLTREVHAIIVYEKVPQFKFKEEGDKIIIEDFEFEYVPDVYPLKNYDYFKMYCEDILNGINRTGESYAYGEILREFDLKVRELPIVKVIVRDEIGYVVRDVVVTLGEYLQRAVENVVSKPYLFDVENLGKFEVNVEKTLKMLIRGVDQLKQLIENIKENPFERYHVSHFGIQ